MKKVVNLKNTSEVKVKNYITDPECKDEALVGRIWNSHCCDKPKGKKKEYK